MVIINLNFGISYFIHASVLHIVDLQNIAPLLSVLSKKIPQSNTQTIQEFEFTVFFLYICT